MLTFHPQTCCHNELKFAMILSSQLPQTVRKQTVLDVAPFSNGKSGHFLDAFLQGEGPV